MNNVANHLASGPVAVVSGARRGLGLALTRELAARGARVAGLVRRAGMPGPTSATEGVLTVVADVSDPNQVRAAFAEVRDRLGPVEILVNNAAVFPHRDFLDETAESIMDTVGVNLGGYVACTRAALEDMVPAGRGRILNVTSFADLAPLPTHAAYALGKGAGRILTRALLADLGDRFPDIVIGDWAPGVLATRMGRPDGIDPAVAARWGAELALDADPSLNGALFERDREILPPRRLRARLADRLLGRTPTPRRLGEASPTRIGSPPATPPGSPES